MKKQYMCVWRERAGIFHRLYSFYKHVFISMQFDCVMQITVNKIVIDVLIFFAGQRSFSYFFKLICHQSICADSFIPLHVKAFWKITRKNFFHCNFPVNRKISQFFTSRLPKTMRQRPVIDSTSVFFALVVVKNINNSLSSLVTARSYFWLLSFLSLDSQ